MNKGKSGVNNRLTNASLCLVGAVRDLTDPAIPWPAMPWRASLILGFEWDGSATRPDPETTSAHCSSRSRFTPRGKAALSAAGMQ